jgi:hypothetical protein
MACLRNGDIPLDIRLYFRYKLKNLAHRRAHSGCYPEGGARAVPAGGFAPRSRAASGTDRPALRPVCEELAALAPGRVLPFAPGNSRKRGPGVEPRGKSLGERRGEAPRGERAPSQPPPQAGEGKRKSALPHPMMRPRRQSRLSALRLPSLGRAMRQSRLKRYGVARTKIRACRSEGGRGGLVRGAT